jgi:hypothetical protein
MTPYSEDWCSIAEQASKEMDPKKLAALVTQLCCAFDERDKRRRAMCESSIVRLNPSCQQTAHRPDRARDARGHTRRHPDSRVHSDEVQSVWVFPKRVAVCITPACELLRSLYRTARPIMHKIPSWVMLSCFGVWKIESASCAPRPSQPEAPLS